MCLGVLSLILKIGLAIITLPCMFLAWIFEKLNIPITFTDILFVVIAIPIAIAILKAFLPSLLDFLLSVAQEIVSFLHNLYISITASHLKRKIKKNGFLKTSRNYSNPQKSRIIADHTIFYFTYNEETFFLTYSLYDKLITQMESQQEFSAEEYRKILHKHHLTDPIWGKALSNYLSNNQKLYHVQVRSGPQFYFSALAIDKAFYSLQNDGCSTFDELCSIYSSSSDTRFLKLYPKSLITKVIELFSSEKKIHRIQFDESSDVLYVFDFVLDKYKELFLRQEPMLAEDYSKLCIDSGIFHISAKNSKYISTLALNQLVDAGKVLTVSIDEGKTMYVPKQFIDACSNLFHTEGAATFNEFVAICSNADIFSTAFQRTPLIADLTLKTLVDNNEAQVVPLDIHPYRLYKSLISSGKMETIEISL